ncbi:MAG: hypothetical protein WC596_02495 [Candidatus Shapirobacteria bacterium]
MNTSNPERKANRPTAKAATKVGLATAAAVVAIGATGCDVSSMVDKFMKTAVAETKAPATWDPNKGLESRTPAVEANVDPTDGLFPLLGREVPENQINWIDISREDIKNQEMLATFDTQVGSRLAELTNYRVVTGEDPQDSVSWTFVKLESGRTLALFIKEDEQQKADTIVAGSFQIRGSNSNWEMTLINTTEKGLVFITFDGGKVTFKGVNGEEVELVLGQDGTELFNAIYAKNTPTPDVETATPAVTESPAPTQVPTTAVPSPTEAPTAEPTVAPTEVKSAEIRHVGNEVEFGFYQPEFYQNMEVEYTIPDGRVLKLPIVIAVLPGMVNRAEEAVKSFDIENPEIKKIYAEYTLQMFYEHSRTEGFGGSFEDYLKSVADGGGQITLATTIEPKGYVQGTGLDMSIRPLTQFSPLDGVQVIMGDQETEGELFGNEMGSTSMYFARSPEGMLVMGAGFFPNWLSMLDNSIEHSQDLIDKFGLENLKKMGRDRLMIRMGMQVLTFLPNLEDEWLIKGYFTKLPERQYEVDENMNTQYFTPTWKKMLDQSKFPFTELYAGLVQ